LPWAFPPGFISHPVGQGFAGSVAPPGFAVAGGRFLIWTFPFSAAIIGLAANASASNAAIVELRIGISFFTSDGRGIVHRSSPDGATRLKA